MASGQTQVSAETIEKTKQQIRAPVIERLALSGDVTDKAVMEIWTAPETLHCIRDYVARTLNK